MRLYLSGFTRTISFEKQPRYNIVVTEDGGKSYDHFSDKKTEYEYGYFYQTEIDRRLE